MQWQRVHYPYAQHDRAIALAAVAPNRVSRCYFGIIDAVAVMVHVKYPHPYHQLPCFRPIEPIWFRRRINFIFKMEWTCYFVRSLSYIGMHVYDEKKSPLCTSYCNRKFNTIRLHYLCSISICCVHCCKQRKKNIPVCSLFCYWSNGINKMTGKNKVQIGFTSILLNECWLLSSFKSLSFEFRSQSLGWLL